MGMPGGLELIAILVIVVLIFGGKKIPELMKGIGSGIKNFKKAVKDEDNNPEIAKTEEKKEETVASTTTTKTEEKKA